MKNKIIEISQHLNSKFYFDYDTSKSVWFKAGGKAAILCLLHDENEFKIILNHIGNVPFEFIGAGSNILIRDNGFDGILFKLGKKFNKILIHEKYIEVGASILDANLAKFAEINSINNFEFFSGIPGSIGGAIKMSAGCYGSETKDILKDVKMLSSKGCVSVLSADKLNLTYRNSNIPKGEFIISANFNYNYGDKETIKQKMNNIKVMRQNTQPIKSKTSGSSFKNPKNNFAAKLIEMADCKELLQLCNSLMNTNYENLI